MKTEIWRVIEGYEGLYEVSDMGRVYSILKGNLVKPSLVNTDKLCLRVNLYKDKKRRTYLVHNLVLEAFVGKRPQGLYALHLDKNQSNNRLENLKWVTRDEISKTYSYDMSGRKPRGFKYN